MEEDKSDLELQAIRIIELAMAQGAQQCAAVVRKNRFIQLTQRKGTLESVREASSAGLTLDLYVDGRYSSNSTSDMRWPAIEDFVKAAVPMTRLLSVDPHRGLADPALYKGAQAVDAGALGILDADYGRVTVADRRARVAEVEALAAALDPRIISVEGGYSDSMTEAARVHSNGFSGLHRATSYWTGADVSVNDPQGRKPSESHWEGARAFDKLPTPRHIAEQASRRALGRIGQTKLASGPMTVVVENKAVGGLLGQLIGAMTGDKLQQNRSFLKDKRDQLVASPLLTLIDDPLLPGGFGTAAFDSDGIAARRRALIDKGVLRELLVDVYYGRKMGVQPTGGGTSNLVIAPGARTQSAIIASVKEGLFITGFLGGNSDSTSGDFSRGLAGYRIKDGALAEPIGEMNITGNHQTLWANLVEVGADPWLSSTNRTPTLVFKDVAVSGT